VTNPDPPSRSPVTTGDPPSEALPRAASPPEPLRSASPAPPPPGPAASENARPALVTPTPRRRRWPWWVLRGVLVALILPGAVLAATLLVAPPVQDAPARVAAIDAAHHAVPVEAQPSWRVVRAVVAAEDSSFYTNHGVDLPGLARALWGRVIGRDLGGSTISEQLAKVVYEQGRTSFLDRLSEVALALKLRGQYSPEAVLSMYLSAIYYGHGYFGVMAASEGYFGVPPDRLSWGQAAMLAGLPQSPTNLDPLRHLAAARRRQSYVLDQLVDTGVLTSAQARAAAAAPLGLR
jgi:hypothetical protein